VLESSDIYHLVRGRPYNYEEGGLAVFQNKYSGHQKLEKNIKTKKFWPDLIFNTVIIENNIYPVLCMK
jgi:hypothetical protein